MRNTVRLLLACFVAGNLLACQKVRVEDDPAEQANATALAQKYIKAFAAGDRALVSQMSAVPFWGDGQVLNTQADLDKELKNQFKDIEKLRFQVKEARYVSVQQLKVMMPNLYSQLAAEKLTEDLHTVLLTVLVEGKTEKGMVLMRRDTEGAWHVVGLGD